MTYDVLIIGGGPAGSSAAAVLAEKGRRVLLLERERFPRYQIGESLLPYCWFPFQRIGMIEKLRNSHFTKKYSVQFVSLDGRVSQPFYFFEHTNHECAQTWQVLRSEFDQMLLDNARQKGCTVWQGAAARELIWVNGTVAGVRATLQTGRTIDLRAPLTIDASGRDAFAVSRLNWRVSDPSLNKIAVWTYYRGARRDPGLDEGATTVAFLPDKGWFWYIALPQDVVSVGIVADREYLYRGVRSPDEMFSRELELQPWIQEHLAGGEKMAPCRVTGDYSYRSRYCAADGLVLSGDAFAFLDPVFSSGVFLALQGGVMAADAVNEALEAGTVSAQHFAEYGRQLCQGIEAMRRLVYAFYDKSFSFAELLEKYPDLRGDLTDCLIGHLWKDFEPLFRAVGEFARLPRRLEHGGPFNKQLLSADSRSSG